MPVMGKVERGDLTVGLGVAFEAAAVLGVPLSTRRRPAECWRLVVSMTDSVLPHRVRKPLKFDDDF